MQVLVIGLDGVCLPVLDSVDRQGRLPRLDELRANSAVAPLESQLPPWTPSAWPSMYTGVNPGKHGVYDFHRFDGYDWDVVNRSHVREFAIWELLSTQGLSSVVVNVPVTHPPRPFDGALVPGYTAPEGATCHPPGLMSEVERALGRYSIYGDTLDAGSTDADQQRELVDLSRMRGEAFRYLVERYDPDFGFVQFQSTDTVYHDFPGDHEAAFPIYRAVDDEVDKILDAIDANLILVVSDHGMGPIDGREFRVNNFLREEGWLQTTAEGSGMPSWKTVTRESTEDDSSRTEAMMANGAALAAQLGLTGPRISAVLERLGLEEWALERLPDALVRAGLERVDYPASQAYMRARTEMGVRLNLDGRDPEGTVTQEEYERIREELIAALRQVQTPDGTTVFELVCPREAVFEGPHLDDAPDIVTVPNQFDQFLVANLKGATFGEPSEPFEHKPDGVVMATGRAVDTTESLDEPHLLDIVPTILASFGLPISDRMDGEPLPIVEHTEPNAYPDFETVADDTETDTDTEAVKQRLSDLGYLH